MSLVRAFLAIPLPRALQQAVSCLQRDLHLQVPGVRWTRSDNLHLTLHFFGETQQETLEKIKVSMLSVKGCEQAFSLEVKGLGAFPSRRRPRVIWLDLEPKEQLRRLHGDCLKALHAAGVATESRPYAPHLTIGRMRQQQPDLTGLCNSLAQITLGHLRVDRLVLFESRLHPAGAEHIPLLTVNFDEQNCKA
jgi:2'-5' RNA ligase